ncbi:PTS mannitol transporter subunit IICBA [Lactiplantibacillus mudanjiangensis]|uniref:PTS system mannitol-specific EIICB component n=1 Tax=Lactiplantibacillus mudanjiangensis TaxID=1296538 RepID=A0A660E1K6_9LACO|nr:PTS mannitol transporter subunit IICBA [Lactiplantibacillus mudanjiangensis]VDG21139.1 PTS mannitol transporter subunit IICBA [Lactobacillus sp.] [Lactiplantibacillus mudanjiangensis]VDG22924.1 PTS mannitol transporter subunit IICBA [Lactobacillus sp.] [Lactiplantibacillus mudanjiangensis]VDG29216.1 PTS mannitol transporter subunit IICBA [Lactobacillus sp.] [Lactiplantibacillus mudanjiangensis]VDG31743.1 PTS mannitol transporter subunit IICBA [Lactobacillus sp.] [Lactiplantibacillus mudanjia
MSENNTATQSAPVAKKKVGVKARVQKFGSALSNMVMPNIGAFIAWGLITAIFMAGGWFPNADLAKMIQPMVHYLLPLLIAFTGGNMIAGHRGGVVGAIATMGVIVGSTIPMFIGAMIMGPLGGWCIKKWDDAISDKVRSGFEMLVNNFSAGIMGMLLAILGYFGIGPLVSVASAGMAIGVNWIIKANLLPLANVFIEPAKILFLNNAINQGILTPLGIQAAASAGKSILFLLEPDPGPGLGILLAFALFGKGSAKASAPSAMIIHFLGGIHEIYFPYVLMKPALFLAVIAGGVTGTATFSLLNVGLRSTPSPGSIIMLFAMAPRSVSNYIGLIVGVTLATLASFLVAAVILKRDKSMTDDSLAAAKGQMSDMKAAKNGEAVSTEDAADVIASYKDVDHIIFACDAGMGSSAMGASLLRDKVKKAGIDMSVTNTAISNLKDEPGLLVITQDELADRANQKAPHALRIAVDNFLSSPKYDQIVVNLKARDQVSDEPAAPASEAAETQADPSELPTDLALDSVEEVVFVHHDSHLGTATMATSLMKDRLKKANKQAVVKNLGIDELQDNNSLLVVSTSEAAKNLKTRYTHVQVLVTDDLLNSPKYDKMVLGLK